MSSAENRETFSSTWGVLLATAGTAIGLGNVWRFPYMMGNYGGASFLVLYLAMVVAFGIPALMAEWSLGRITRGGPLGAFKRSGLPWGRFLGYALFVTVTMAASYYAVVIAWVLHYSFVFATGGLAKTPGDEFGHLTSGLLPQMTPLLVTIAVATLALYLGVRRGIERISRVALPLFFLLFMILIVRVATLEGAGEGLAVFFQPRWDEITLQTPLAALGQAFFSLALGGTFMLIYGSYIHSREAIPRNAVFTSLADVSAAVMAGLVVVPSVIAFGIELDSGPSLLFVTMPEVFERLPHGNLFGAIFFLSVFLVAVLSLIAAYEVVVGGLCDEKKWNRNKLLLGFAALQMVLAIPSLLSQEYLTKSDLIWGSTMQPLGGGLAILALAWSIGRTRALEEMRRNSRLPVPVFLFYWIKYAIPAGIISTLILGWWPVS